MKHITRGQWQIILTLASFQFVDGFDLFSLSLASSDIIREWHVSTTLMGSAMAFTQFGSIFAAASVGALSQRMTTRRLMLSVTVLLTAGSLLTATSLGIGMLLLARFVTGLGLGAAIPLTVSYAAQHTSERLRGVTIAMVLNFLPIGQIIAGLSSGWITQAHGWRTLFILASGLSFAILPLLASLSTEQPPAITSTFGQLSGVEVACAGFINNRHPLTFLWNSEGKVPLITVVSIAFLSSFVIYALFGWVPFLLVHSGFSSSLGSMSAAFLAGGGMLGNLLWGRMCDLISPYSSIGLAFLLGGLVMCCLAVTGISPLVILVLCGALGFFVVGGYMAIATFVATVFPQHSQIHVLSLMTIATRSGGLLAPIAAGYAIRDGTAGSILFNVGAGLSILVATLLLSTGYYAAIRDRVDRALKQRQEIFKL